jgi:hypothetical protein
MRKHTPGPWFAASEGSYKVASVTSNTGIYADTLPEAAQIAADARLIASAPDLLDALKRISEFRLQDFMGPCHMAMECVAVAKSAIAKAGSGA